MSALSISVLESLRQRAPDMRLCVFDHGHGVRTHELGDSKRDHPVELCGATQTRRLYRPESLSRIRFACRWGGLYNAAARRILAADAILDISGGDSFTDLYGRWRFRQVSLPKMIAIEAKRPLILLPQTYGPFEGSQARCTASRIVKAAKHCWARDQRSFGVLKELLADDFEPERHRLGIDVAFLLGQRKPLVSREIEEWLDQKDGEPVVGFNVSGLIWNQPERSRSQYSLIADYREVVLNMIERIARAGARVLLVPHVVTQVGHYESDVQACEEVQEQMRDREFGARVLAAPAVDDPREAKWMIAQCDWFCGTRMHSTIAALSSGVPTAAIAYTEKTLGVFETCGQGRQVADPRKLSTEEMIEHLWSSWEGRDQAKSDLALHLPGVLSQAEDQMDAIVECIKRCSNQPAACSC